MNRLCRMTQFNSSVFQLQVALLNVMVPLSLLNQVVTQYNQGSKWLEKSQIALKAKIAILKGLSTL
jgi:hypothetical protein